MARVQWHSAFTAAMQIELRDNKALSYEGGVQLNEKPLEVDLIIEKPPDTVITNPLGEIFKAHNIIEYKSPTDHGFNYSVIAQALSYAGYYCQKYKTLDVTLTIIVSKSHFNLLKWLKRNDIAYSKRHEGIYDLYASPLPISVQLVITEELDKSEFKWLASLTDRITKEQVSDVATAFGKFTDSTDIQLAEAVLRVISDANEEVFSQTKEEDKAMDVLRKMFEQDFEEEKRNSIKKNNMEIIGRMIKNGLDNSIIVKCTNMPENEIEAMRSSMTV